MIKHRDQIHNLYVFMLVDGCFVNSPTDTFIQDLIQPLLSTLLLVSGAFGRVDLYLASVPFDTNTVIV